MGSESGVLTSVSKVVFGIICKVAETDSKLKFFVLNLLLLAVHDLGVTFLVLFLWVLTFS